MFQVALAACLLLALNFILDSTTVDEKTIDAIVLIPVAVIIIMKSARGMVRHDPVLTYDHKQITEINTSRLEIKEDIEFTEIASITKRTPSCLEIILSEKILKQLAPTYPELPQVISIRGNETGIAEFCLFLQGKDIMVKSETYGEDPRKQKAIVIIAAVLLLSMLAGLIYFIGFPK
ncbi:MAG: hypothetical protein V4736_14355 [Bdellovibrionota bacterium]